MIDQNRIVFLYRVTCLENNKIYIGQTVNTSKRWSQHRRDSASPKVPFHHAIKKYGAHRFVFEVIATCRGFDNANELETQLVKQYDSFVAGGKGYNATHGGMNAPKSPEWCQYMSDLFTGREAQWLIGNKHSLGRVCPENEKQHKSEWMLSHPEAGKRFQEGHQPTDNCIKGVKQYHQDHPEHSLNTMVKWRLDNPEKVAEQYANRVYLPNAGNFKKTELSEQDIANIISDIRPVKKIAREYKVGELRIRQIKNR